MKKKKTSIETRVENYLIENNIIFESQYYLYYEINNIKKYKVYDIFLNEYDLLIEIDGDYWHSNPNIYDSDKLNETQQKK